jgi:hypothetical protein
LIKQLVEFLNNNFKMLVRLVVVCMLVSCLGCRNDMSKSGYHSTLPICDRRFFVETFTIMGGELSAEIANRSTSRIPLTSENILAHMSIRKNTFQ